MRCITTAIGLDNFRHLKGDAAATGERAAAGAGAAKAGRCVGLFVLLRRETHEHLLQVLQIGIWNLSI
jgi:hypothetical protein